MDFRINEKFKKLFFRVMHGQELYELYRNEQFRPLKLLRFEVHLTDRRIGEEPNIFMNGAILGMKRREVAHKMDEIIAFSEIDSHHVDTPVKRYSSGMYVRLGFAVGKLCNKGLILEQGKITKEQCPIEDALVRFKEILGIG